MEIREFRADPVGVNDEGKLFGSAVPFNRETVIGDLKRGGWKEEFASGSLSKSVNDGDVIFLAHHDMHQPLARMSAGNLTLRAENDRLAWEADPVDTSYGRDIRALAKAKVLGGVSVGFIPIKDEWRDDAGNPSDEHRGTHRVIREAKLIEISAVTNPAYKDTSIMARDELLATREARAEREGSEERASLDAALDAVLDILGIEGRAAAVGEKDRKALADKGHALPDGSYPIPDIAHLHAAAILAASHHGDWKAAQELIRKRAPELGVDVKSLPGFNDSDEKDSRNEEPTTEDRDDPDGKEFAAIDAAIDLLGAEKPDPAHALKVLQACRKGTRSEQEPEPSTPEPDDDDFALLVSHREAEERSRELGYV